ncbi:MAG: fluoride efflux transporter CrcB [Phycisphaerae bacterium]|nr:fluoride efflux transporter CrcB [Phycisphaerae bacterium]
MNLAHVGLVFLGGGMGSVARFAVTTSALSLSTRWPVGTFLCNALGCAAAGAFVAIVDARASLSAETRLLVMTGFLGGFTTFSAMSHDALGLSRAGHATAAAAYAVGTLAVSIAGVVLGWLTCRALIA